jgi:hypothetical protein
MTRGVTAWPQPISARSELARVISGSLVRRGMSQGLSSSVLTGSQLAYVVPNLLTVLVDFHSSRGLPTKPFVQPLSASVRFVRPQLSAGETPLSGANLGCAQHLRTQSSSPTIGTHSNHRYVRESRQRVRAGPVTIEGLTDECHRHKLAVFFHKLCEARRISKATLDLSFGLCKTTAGHRSQRQPKLRLPSDVRCYALRVAAFPRMTPSWRCRNNH